MTLSGQRVLVLRPRRQAQGVADALSRLGAQPLVVPALEIVPPEDPAPFEDALSRLGDYDWLVLTSSNGVQAVFERVNRLPSGLKVAAVGPTTARELESRGVTVDLIPPVATAESLAEALSRLAESPGDGAPRVLFPKANRARDVIPAKLRAAGMRVDDPIAYRSLDALGEGEGLELLREGKIDWVLLTSPSTLEALIDRVDTSVWARTRLASIGPVTSASIRRHGLEVTVEAKPHTLEGLIAAIAAYPPPPGP